MEPSQIPTSSPNPPYQNWVQTNEVEWNCSNLIETTNVNVNVNAIEVQGIWDEKDEALKKAVAIWGILLLGHM